MPPHPNAQYFLHDSGALTFTPLGGVTEKPPIKKIWLAADVIQSPIYFALFLREAKAAGALTERLIELYMANQMWNYDEALAVDIGMTDLQARLALQQVTYKVGHAHNQVMLSFNKPVSALPLTPMEAAKLAAQLVANADAAVPEGKPN